MLLHAYPENQPMHALNCTQNEIAQALSDIVLDIPKIFAFLHSKQIFFDPQEYFQLHSILSSFTPQIELSPHGSTSAQTEKEGAKDSFEPLSISETVDQGIKDDKDEQEDEDESQDEDEDESQDDHEDEEDEDEEDDVDLTSPLLHLLPRPNKEKERSGCKYKYKFKDKYK